MEGVSASMYKGFKGYWKKSGYEKLNGSGSRRRMNRVQLGGSSRRRRTWRIKIAPKLRFLRKVGSPKKLLVWLRDAYVKLMLGFANSRVCSAGYGGVIGCDGIGGFRRDPLKEYDEKMLVQIYKSIVLAQGQLVPCEAAKLGTEIISQR